ncbi:hypothetical protein [Bradyrhizobium sp. ORS 111]|uniref:hypothetical protein n=1 Tax=Bradyrhizobium sp. ORS 111 TaxID=1685958 RepID=UPI003890DC1A
MTAQPENAKRGQRAASKTSQEEVARSLERELRLLTEERHDRARQLGLDIGAAAPRVRD